MTTLSELTSEINTLIDTNLTGDVSAADVRTVLIDMCARILADLAIVADAVTSVSITAGEQVLLVIGDSTVATSLPAGDQSAAAAAYVPSALIHVMNASGAFVQYTPGTMAGMDHLNNGPAIGPEYQFVARWRAKFPTTHLYICKVAASGAPQARGNIWGTFASVSAASGLYTYPSGALAQNTLLLGSGVPPSTYVADSAGHKLGTIGTVGQNTSISFASTSVDGTRADSSYSPTEGCLYAGLDGRIDNGARGLINTALATLINPRIRTMIYSMGINDCSTSVSDATTLFPRDMKAFLDTFDADFPIPNSVIKRFLMRPAVSFSNAQTIAVRNAVANEAATRTNTYMINMDSATRWDGVHYDKAGIDMAANFAFDTTFP